MLLLDRGYNVQGAEVAIKTGIIKGTITVAGKPTADVVVSVEGIPAEHRQSPISAAKPKKAVMDQREMKFSPSRFARVVGTTVEFPNHDTAWHNVYSKGGAKDFDLGLYPPGKSHERYFDKPGVVRVLCNAHPNMEAFIVVKEHPLFSPAPTKEATIDWIVCRWGNIAFKFGIHSSGPRRLGLNWLREGEVLDVNFDLKKK